jgi:hypothetical protein
VSLLARLLSHPSEAPDDLEDEDEEWIEPVAAGSEVHLWSGSGAHVRTEVDTDLDRPVTEAMPTFLAGEHCGDCGADLARQTAFYTDSEQWLCADCFRAKRHTGRA